MLYGDLTVRNYLNDLYNINHVDDSETLLESAADFEVSGVEMSRNGVLSVVLISHNTSANFCCTGQCNQSKLDRRPSRKKRMETVSFCRQLSHVSSTRGELGVTLEIIAQYMFEAFSFFNVCGDNLDLRLPSRVNSRHQ